jgi:hypothetical protein
VDERGEKEAEGIVEEAIDRGPDSQEEERQADPSEEVEVAVLPAERLLIGGQKGAEIFRQLPFLFLEPPIFEEKLAVGTAPDLV